jgi:hypothetical protein
MSRLDPNAWSEARYPANPGFVRGSTPSREAAQVIKRKSESLETFVLSVLRIAGMEGLTDGEIQSAAAREGIVSLLRPRRATLLARGEIRDSGRTRPSPTSGLQMTVWVCV